MRPMAKTKTKKVLDSKLNQEKALGPGKDKPQKFITESSSQSKNPQPQKAKRIAWWLVATGILLAIIIGASLTAWWYATAFERTAGVPLASLISEVRSQSKNPFEQQDRVTILLLGLDEVRNRQEGSLLTDTMMLISINQSGQITLVSIPRDLWIDELKTKINALYYYGEINDQTTGVDLIKSVTNEITGIQIDYTILIGLDLVKKFIDALGGIMVNVERSFEDHKFPRDDVDLSSDDPDLLYETISFEAGDQWFDGDTALKFIRSRNSEDLTEGTDIARSLRQQRVIHSLLTTLKSPSLLLKPEVLGKLYFVWSEDIQTDLTDAHIYGLLRNMTSSNLNINAQSIPITQEDELGILYHPPVSKHGQWVYEPVDPSWQELQNWFETAFAD